MPCQQRQQGEVSARTVASVAFSPTSQLPARSHCLSLCEAQPKVKPLFYTLARQRHRDHCQHSTVSTTRPSNHSVGAQFCRRLLLGTWSKRTLVLDLAPPHLPPSEQPNRLAKNCDDLRRIALEKRRSNPSLPCSIQLPPARPCARQKSPAPVISQPGVDRQQGASWSARSEHIDRGPSSSVGSQSHNSPSHPCPSSISAFLAEENLWPVKRRPFAWVCPQSDLKDQGAAPLGHHCGFLDSIP